MTHEYLKKNDVDCYLDLLSSKYYMGTILSEKKQNIFLKIDQNPDHIIYVVKKEDELVGTATLLIMSNKLKNVGKIDDMVVSQEIDDILEVKKLLVVSLVKIAHSKDCEKITIKEIDDMQLFCDNLGVIKNKDIVINDNKEYY